jgi:hypothetical protein
MPVARAFSTPFRQPRGRRPSAPRRPQERRRSGRKSPLGTGPACLPPIFFYVPCDFFSYELLTVPHMRNINHIRNRHKGCEDERRDHSSLQGQKAKEVSGCALLLGLWGARWRRFYERIASSRISNGPRYSGPRTPQVYGHRSKRGIKAGALMRPETMERYGLWNRRK